MTTDDITYSSTTNGKETASSDILCTLSVENTNINTLQSE